MLFKRFSAIWGLLLLGLLIGAASAQSTTVSVNVTDASNQVWSNGTISYVFQKNPQYSGNYEWGGSSTLLNQYLVPTVVNLDVSGNANFTIPSSSAITPSGSSWTYVVCPNASYQCAVLNIPATGTTQNISSIVNAQLPVLNIPAAPFPRAYNNSEISVPPNYGGFYYDTINKVPKFWDGSIWQQFLTSGGTGFVTTSPSGNQNIVQPAGTRLTANLFGSTNIFNYPSGVSANPFATQVQLSDNTTALGSGWSFGNVGGWLVTKQTEQNCNFYVRGITQCQNINLFSTKVGDEAGAYIYAHCSGGNYSQSDEGCDPLTAESIEDVNYFRGTIGSTTGTGDTFPGLTYVSGKTSTTDGGILLDISRGTIVGSLNGSSTPFGNSSFFLNKLPVTGVTLPLSTAYGTTPSITIPVGTADSRTSITIPVTLGTIGGTAHAFTTGIACVAGIQYPEQGMITSAPAAVSGVQTITITVRNENQSGATIFQGGICGQYISADADFALSQMRTTYFAFGSLTGSDMIYAYEVNGCICNSTLPEVGNQMWTTTGSGAGFHLYPGAEIVANTTTGAAPKLEVNATPWAVGDTIENPNYMAMTQTAFAGIVSQNSINPPGRFNSGGMRIGLFGYGIAGYNFSGINITNGGPPHTAYKGWGGPLNEPVAISLSNGPFANLIASYYIPGGANPIFQFTALEGDLANAADSSEHSFFGLPSSGNGFFWTPSTDVIRSLTFRANSLGVTSITSPSPAYACFNGANGALTNVGCTGTIGGSTKGAVTLSSGTATITTSAACSVSIPGSCSYSVTHCGGMVPAIGILQVSGATTGVSFTIQSLTTTNTIETGDSNNVCWAIN